MTDRHGGSVVLVAYRYPPMIGPGSHRAASFARHLPERGWQPVVVTVRGGLFHRDSNYQPPPVPTLRTRAVEPTQLLAPLRGSGKAGRAGEDAGSQLVASVTLGPKASRLRRFVNDYVYIPDAYALWIPFAAAAVWRAIELSAAPTVLLSSSVPYSAHVACLLVARRARVPWIAEFRDPWARLADGVRQRSPTRKRIDAALERRVVEAATGLIVTSDLTRQAMLSTYPHLSPERVSVVRNGFEPSYNPPPPPPNTAPLRLVNAGSVQPDTPLEPLLRGIDRVAMRHPGGVELHVFAPPEPWRQAADALGNPDWLRLQGLVTPAAAQCAVAGASVNILLRPGEQHNEYVAAKLMDYLGACRPILGVVSPTGEMATLGREYGDMRVIPDYNEDAIAAVVEAFLDQHRRGQLAGRAEGSRPVAELTRAAQAARLAQVLASVV